MTNEEFAKGLADVPLTAIATGLLTKGLLGEIHNSAFAEALEQAKELPQNYLETALSLSDDERRQAVGARVRMMRKLQGMTQAQLASRIGVSKQAVTTYELGRREAPYKNLLALSKALGVTTDWLLGATP